MKNNFKETFNGTPILITGHINPDGDAVGSALALKLLLDFQLREGLLKPL